MMGSSEVTLADSRLSDHAEPHEQHGLVVGQPPARLAQERGRLVGHGVVELPLRGAPLLGRREARVARVDDVGPDRAEGDEGRALDLDHGAVAPAGAADGQAGAGPRRAALEVPLAGDRDRHALLAGQPLLDRALARPLVAAVAVLEEGLARRAPGDERDGRPQTGALARRAVDVQAPAEGL